MASVDAEQSEDKNQIVPADNKSNNSNNDFDEEGSEGSDYEMSAPIDFAEKHYLKYRWTMWWNPPFKKGAEWKVEKVLSFDTVEDFWCLYNHLAKPSMLKAGSNYHMFKDGVKPEWEDEENKNGGKWIIDLKKDAQKVDDAWMNIILAMIGEQDFQEYSDEICGVVVSPRAKGNKLALWTKSADMQDKCEDIGHKFKRITKYSGHASYQAHLDSIQSNSSFRNRERYKI
jgi:translation initiation factor 4E